jgi:hypothetical protein
MNAAWGKMTPMKRELSAVAYVRLRADGFSQSQCSIALGIPWQTLYKWRQKYISVYAYGVHEGMKRFRRKRGISRRQPLTAKP